MSALSDENIWKNDLALVPLIILSKEFSALSSYWFQFLPNLPRASFSQWRQLIYPEFWDARLRCAVRMYPACSGINRCTILTTLLDAGDSAVGKTSLLGMYTSKGQKFPKSYNAVRMFIQYLPVYFFYWYCSSWHSCTCTSIMTWQTCTDLFFAHAWSRQWVLRSSWLRSLSQTRPL